MKDLRKIEVWTYIDGDGDPLYVLPKAILWEISDSEWRDILDEDDEDDTRERYSSICNIDDDSYRRRLEQIEKLQSEVKSSDEAKEETSEPEPEWVHFKPDGRGDESIWGIEYRTKDGINFETPSTSINPSWYPTIYPKEVKEYYDKYVKQQEEAETAPEPESPSEPQWKEFSFKNVLHRTSDGVSFEWYDAVVTERWISTKGMPDEQDVKDFYDKLATAKDLSEASHYRIRQPKDAEELDRLFRESYDDYEKTLEELCSEPEKYYYFNSVMRDHMFYINRIARDSSEWRDSEGRLQVEFLSKSPCSYDKPVWLYYSYDILLEGCKEESLAVAAEFERLYADGYFDRKAQSVKEPEETIGDLRDRVILLERRMDEFVRTVGKLVSLG